MINMKNEKLFICYSKSKNVKLFLLFRSNVLNPYCGLGAYGFGNWTLVMKIDGSKVKTDKNIYISDFVKLTLSFPSETYLHF